MASGRGNGNAASADESHSPRPACFAALGRNSEHELVFRQHRRRAHRGSSSWWETVAIGPATLGLLTVLPYLIARSARVRPPHGSRPHRSARQRLRPDAPARAVAGTVLAFGAIAATRGSASNSLVASAGRSRPLCGVLRPCTAVAGERTIAARALAARAMPRRSRSCGARCSAGSWWPTGYSRS